MLAAIRDIPHAQCYSHLRFSETPVGDVVEHGLVETVCRQDGGARAYRGKTGPAEVPVALLPVARARHPWRALALQAKQDCVAMQVFTACLNKPIPDHVTFPISMHSGSTRSLR
jgi:hypothetical protein